MSSNNSWVGGELGAGEEERSWQGEIALRGIPGTS